MILGTIRCIAWRQDLLHGPGAELSREEVDFALRGGGVRGSEQTGERVALDRSLWGEKHKQRRRGRTIKEMTHQACAMNVFVCLDKCQGRVLVSTFHTSGGIDRLLAKDEFSTSRDGRSTTTAIDRSWWLDHTCGSWGICRCCRLLRT
jgi:hypothetical protein